MRLVLIALICCAVNIAIARDLGQWGDTSPEEREWYTSARQPDHPTISCCGEADAYWADGFEQDGDQYVAIITDERADEPKHRPHREPGTKIKVPNHKINTTNPNPDGHGVIFLAPGSDYVYCYFPPGGV